VIYKELQKITVYSECYKMNWQNDTCIKIHNLDKVKNTTVILVVLPVLHAILVHIFIPVL
jgi:hypothetical protein